jgi:phospholipid/cholesterol/gamma-HCH transport system permease protein
MPRIAFFAIFGRKIFNGINHLGAMLIFFGLSISKIFHLKQIPRVVEQVFFIGAKTVNIVALIGLFTGMVMALQLYHSLVKFGSETVLGSAVALALIRELGPVLTAIMIIARAGSSMTAEIGVMRISEQIDALYTMRIDPLGYLVSPRIAASIISFPLLTAWFDIIGLIGGYFTGVMLLGVNAGAYVYRVHTSVEIQDVSSGFVKALVFAAIVSTICCYQGYFTHMRAGSHGARSVSLSTTSAVVLSCVSVLIADYIVTSIML